MESNVYLVTATTNEGIILREIFESKDDALLFEKTELKSQLREMYGDYILQNNSLQLGFGVLNLHARSDHTEKELAVKEPNAYDTATYLKRLSESHCNPEIQRVLFEASVLLCNQQDKIKEQQADRRLVNESINNEELWWWQGDGEDYLQSLCNSVNVIISAKKLREIIQPHLITSEINNVYPEESLFASYDREDAFDEAMKIV